MTAKNEDVPLTFIDNAHAPEVFATEATGFFLTPGNVHITLAAARVNHEKNPGPVNRVVIARLVMPVGAAQGLAAGLYDFLKSRGYDLPAKPADEKLQ